MSTKPTPVADRLWSRVHKSDGCWLWMGSTKRNGYGQISVGGRVGTMALVHRVAWEVANGPIPDGMQVCHRCDVPRCVRPDHLFLGSHSDNMKDRNLKGRQAHGERHPRARMDEATAREVRRLFLAGAAPSDIARRLGISVRAADQAGRGRSWRSL